MRGLSEKPRTSPTDTMADSHKDLARDKDRQGQRPPLYKILLHNDDYTPADWVVDLLMSLFRRPQREAELLMLAVHANGSAVVGVYTHEVAETKVAQVYLFAREGGHPLQATMEPDV